MGGMLKADGQTNVALKVDLKVDPDDGGDTERRHFSSGGGAQAFQSASKVALTVGESDNNRPSYPLETSNRQLYVEEEKKDDQGHHRQGGRISQDD